MRKVRTFFRLFLLALTKEENMTQTTSLRLGRSHFEKLDALKGALSLKSRTAVVVALIENATTIQRKESVTRLDNKPLEAVRNAQ